MKTHRISELIGMLEGECRKESVECIVVIAYDGSSEIYQTMETHSPAIERSILSLSDPFFRKGNMSLAPAEEKISHEDLAS